MFVLLGIVIVLHFFLLPRAASAVAAIFLVVTQLEQGVPLLSLTAE